MTVPGVGPVMAAHCLAPHADASSDAHHNTSRVRRQPTLTIVYPSAVRAIADSSALLVRIPEVVEDAPPQAGGRLAAAASPERFS